MVRVDAILANRKGFRDVIRLKILGRREVAGSVAASLGVGDA